MSLTTTITWIPIAEGKPDAEITVLLGLSDGDSCEGFYDGQRPDGKDVWRDVTSVDISSRVTHYAQMPTSPGVSG